MQDKFYPLNSALKKMWGRLKFTYEALKQITPNLVALTQAVQSQTKACITKSSYVNKIENRAQLKLTDIFFFLEIFHCINF